METKVIVMTGITPKHFAHQLPQDNYYEKERRKYADLPFQSPSDEHDFTYPLQSWGEYCQANRELRRSHYTVEKYFTEGNIKDSSLVRLQYPRADKTPLDIYLWKGKIEQLELDACVNAANETLLGGGGVDQAIHAAAGPMLVKECAHIKGGCDVGDAKMTKGYCLPANYVLHTVGPILKNNITPDSMALKSCYVRCLNLAEDSKLSSVAFPCISCGFYGYPVDQSAHDVLECLKAEAGNLKSVKTVVICIFSDRQQEAYLKTFLAEKH